jgi:hypothetical protein
MLVTNHPDQADYMNVQLLVETDAFKKLSPLARRFVVDYVAMGLDSGTYDAVAATRFALGQNKPNIQVRAHQMMSNQRIRHVLDLHFRRSELEVLLSAIQRAAKKSDKLGLLYPAVAKALIVFAKYVDTKEVKS